MNGRTNASARADGKYIWAKSKMELISDVGTLTTSYNLPSGSIGTSYVEFNGELHMIGSTISGATRTHYKTSDLQTWERMNNLPIDFANGSAIVYADTIHLFCETSHYQYDAEDDVWEQLTDIPFDFKGDACVFNNKIHLVGINTNILSNSYRGHYTYSTLDGFVYSGDTIVSAQNCCLVNFDNTLNIFIGNSRYRFNAQTFEWSKIEVMPFAINRTFCDLNGDLYFVSSNGVVKYDGIEYVQIITDSSITRNANFSLAAFDGKVLLCGGTLSPDIYYFVMNQYYDYTFIDFITSDIATKYPKDGKMGNYYYTFVKDVSATY